MSQLSLEPPVVPWRADDRYQIRRSLGEGGYGQVFEAWDPLLCRSVALKRLKLTPGAVDPGSLLREGRLAASLRHPAFVRIFGIEGADSDQAIVMELVPGQTLRVLIEQGAPTRARALDLIAQAAEAMSEAHAHGLVHGDLKPSNLMCEPDGKLRILDFGLATQEDPMATRSVVCDDPLGTIAYLAPERLLGQPPAPAGDIFALGVVLFELLGGQLPFRHLRGLAQAAAQMQAGPASWCLPDGGEPALAALVCAMTARDPSQRLASMAELRGALLRGGLVPVPAIVPVSVPVLAVADYARLPVPALRWLRPPRRLWRRAVAVLLAATLGGAGLWAWDYVASAPFSQAEALSDGIEHLRTFERDGSLARAQQQFEAVLERRPAHAGAAAGLALAYAFRYAGDSLDEVWLLRAAASAQQALRLDDQLALAYAAQAWVVGLQGKPDAALALEEQALRLDPRQLFALHGKAELLLELRRFDAAAEAIAAGQDAYPAERLFSDLLGTLRYQRSDYVGAEQAFRRSLALDPDAAVSYANLNAALLRQGRADEALQVLQQGLQVRPSGRLYDNLGTALFGRGDYVGAAQAYQHAISASKGSPNDYLKWANLADTLRWLPGRAADARRASEQAAALLTPLLARTPHAALLQSRMGLYRARLGQADEARRRTALALAGAPDSADVHFRAALAEEILGRRAAALTHLARARALGYPINLIETEPDLVALRRDPRAHPPLQGNQP
jgi:tetratricopeptide (TPR) repeat protein